MQNQAVIEAPKCPKCYERNKAHVTMVPSTGDTQLAHGQYECPNCQHVIQR